MTYTILIHVIINLILFKIILKIRHVLQLGKNQHCQPRNGGGGITPSLTEIPNETPNLDAQLEQREEQPDLCFLILAMESLAAFSPYAHFH